MYDISVEHQIGDKVQYILGDEEMIVIGYEYVHGRGTRYIVTDKLQKRSYVYGFELIAVEKQKLIGFTIHIDHDKT